MLALAYPALPQFTIPQVSMETLRVGLSEKMRMDNEDVQTVNLILRIGKRNRANTRRGLSNADWPFSKTVHERERARPAK